MIHQRLRSNIEVGTLVEHTDEDTICAFLEGRLEEEGASQMVSHLIVCSSCRRTTAEVTRLESEFGSEDDATIEDNESGRLRQALENLASRVFPSQQEDVVFAYQNPPEEDIQEAEASENESDQPTKD